MFLFANFVEPSFLERVFFSLKDPFVHRIVAYAKGVIYADTVEACTVY